MAFFQDFIEFIRERGVVGLAVGFMLGGAVSKLVAALVQDIINPLLGVFIGSGETLAQYKTTFGSVEFLWGDFLKVLIDFLVVAFVVYFGMKIIGIDKLDKKKD